MCDLLQSSGSSNDQKSRLYEDLYWFEIEQAYGYVVKRLGETTLVHSAAVAEIGKMLAIEERADPVVVRIAAYFHDIAKDQVPFDNHASAASAIFDAFIQQNNGYSLSSGLSIKLIDNIAHCIETHVSSWRGSGPMPETIEAKVLSDADMLQQLSPFGLVKHMEKHAALPFAERLENTLKDLERAYDVLLTPTAQGLGQEKMQYVRDFIKAAISG